MDYDEFFDKLNFINGKIIGVVVKQEMVRSKFFNFVFGKIWKLVDIDKDGMLDMDEWVLVNYLIKIKLEGYDLSVDLFDYFILLFKKKEKF